MVNTPLTSPRTPLWSPRSKRSYLDSFNGYQPQEQVAGNLFWPVDSRGFPLAGLGGSAAGTLHPAGTSTDYPIQFSGSGVGYASPVGSGSGSLPFTLLDSPQTVTNYQFGTGNGSTSAFTLTSQNGPALAYMLTSLTRTDWQGTVPLSNTPNTNYVLYSNAQNNSSFYDMSGATLTSGITDPAGGTQAFQLTATAANGFIEVTHPQLAPFNGTYTMSLWLKRVSGSGEVYATGFGAGFYPTGSWSVAQYSGTIAASQPLYFYVALATSGDVVDIAFFQTEFSTTVNSFIPTAASPVTVTDYSISGNTVNLGQIPVSGAALKWSGTTYSAGATIYPAGGSSGTPIQFNPTITASNNLFGTGNGSQNIFNIVGAGGALISNLNVTGISRTDWQGTNTLSTSARTNVLPYSQSFANWTNGGTTIVSNTILDPAGTNTASQFSGGTNADFFSTTASLSNTYTLSVWAQLVSGSGSVNYYMQGGNTGSGSWFSPTTTWTRYSIILSLGTDTQVGMQLNLSGGVINVAFAQLEVGSTATAYIPTTSSPASVTDYSISGNTVTLGQVPVSGALLGWSGTGTEGGAVATYWGSNQVYASTTYDPLAFYGSASASFTGGTTYNPWRMLMIFPRG